jgi:DNA-binding response OmpR family regulator
MKILYVENHAVFAENVKRQFLSHHLVTVVPSLFAARRAMLGEAFDVVLVDYDLDDGKGDELVRALRLSHSNVAIIGVSSHEEGNAALMRAGAAAVCSKMNFDQIQKVIDRIAPDHEGRM